MSTQRRTYRVTRDLTEAERESAGDPAYRRITLGEVVHEYKAYTYGCIESGIAVSREPGDQGPFFEVPRDAVEVITGPGESVGTGS